MFRLFVEYMYLATKKESRKNLSSRIQKSNLNQFGKLLEELLTIKITLITVFIYGLYIIQLKLASVLRQNSIDLNSLILSLSLNTHKPYISPKRFLIMIKLSFNSTSISESKSHLNHLEKTDC